MELLTPPRRLPSATVHGRLGQESAAGNPFDKSGPSCSVFPPKPTVDGAALALAGVEASKALSVNSVAEGFSAFLSPWGNHIGANIVGWDRLWQENLGSAA